MKNFAQKTHNLLRPILKFLDQMDKANINMASAGVAYFTLMAVFPAMAAGVAICLFIITPEQINAIMAGISSYMPGELAQLLAITLERQSAQTGSNIAVAAVSITLALIGASGAVQNMFRALNTIYKTKETRNIVKIYGLGITLTLGVMILVALVSILLLASSDRLQSLGMDALWAEVIAAVRWLVMIILIHSFISALFAYGPNRKITRPRPSRGTIIATLLWLGVTALFFIYVQYLPAFARSYSVFAGMIALMMWFQLGSMAILTGAMLDKTQHPSSDQ